MRFRISGWGASITSGAKASQLEKNFQLDHIFNQDNPTLDSFRGAVFAAILIENKKQEICRKLKLEFHRGWRAKEIDSVLNSIVERLTWLEKAAATDKSKE